MSRELAAYAGSYEDAGYGKAEISLVDGGLVISWSNFKSKLEHFHFDAFNAVQDRLATEQTQFMLGADGEISGMNFLGVSFKKSQYRAR